MHARSVGLLFCWIAAGSVALGVEPYREFLDGLRERQYYDLATSYLQQIELDPATPDEIRVVLPYEKGVTLLAGSRLLRNPEQRERQLDEAQSLFEQFVNQSPDHPLAAQANTERAHILLDKALVEVWQADSPSNQGNREAYRQRARALIEQARNVFQKARDQHQAAWDKVKGFIPEDQKLKRAERAKIEGLFMQAQVDLARCTYEEAQTYDVGSERRNDLLNSAAEQFEAIHQKYRSQIAGLHARMWQGKCFEEQDDIRKALGIYNEILEHPGDQLRALQDRVLWFRLICLNHDSRKDHQLVIDEATTWRKESRDRLRTTVGLGIQFELARAQLALAESDRSLSDILKTDLMKQALDNAQAVGRYPGPHKAPAQALAQRLMVSLNREGGDPQDFDTAFGAANLQLEESKQLTGRINEAKATGDTKEVAELETVLQAAAAEMARLYELSLRLATPRNDPEQVHLAWFRLAYAYFLQEQFLESGILADYVARQFAQQAPQVSVESAYIALAAFDRLFAEAEPTDRDFEMQKLMSTARYIAETWPESDRAVDARMAVARLYRQTDEPDLAAEWYAQVPQTAHQYADAQMSAGQSYWNAYLTRASLPEEERPPAEALADWLLKGEQHLATGVEKHEQELAADAPPPEDLILGKLSLVQIRNRQGAYTTVDGRKGAIELLTEAPHAVIDAVAVPDGQPRPTSPGAMQSQAIASLAYQQLLRAQIGMRDLEGARKTRETLEAIAGEGGDAGALTQVYVEFGRELEKELEQLKLAGETQRLNEVREAFESFLSDLFKRKEGQTFNSLLWIAETYTGLAEGSSGDSTKANSYYDKAAATYDEIVQRTGGQPDFAPSPGQLVAVKLRLVNCRRQQGNFQEADTVIRQVLAERENALDAQIEAARLYEEWADRGIGDSVDKLQTAIHGQQPGPVWGWATIAQKLQRAIEFGESSSDYQSKHLDARYHLARCEFRLAEEQPDEEIKREHMNAARFGIQRFIAITDTLPESDWQRFNQLYQQILTALGEPPAPLPRRTTAPSTGDHEVASSGPSEEPTVTATAPVATETSPLPAPSGSSKLLMVLVIVVVGIGMIGGIYMMTVQQDKKRRARYQAHSSPSRERRSRGRSASGSRQ